MENTDTNESSVELPRLPCHCWQCYIEAELIQDFGSIQEYRCPKCAARIRIDQEAIFDPLRTLDDESDSISVCVSPSTFSRRSTITYSESEAGTSDDVEPRPLTPDNFDQLSVASSSNQIPSAPTNTPVVEPDVPDAPPNIAMAFADVTNFLLNVPTPRRRSERLSFGGLSSIYSGSESVSPSRMIHNVVEAYKKRFPGLDESLTEAGGKMTDRSGQNIEIRITQSPDINELKPQVFTRKVSSSDILGNENAEPGNVDKKT